MSSAPNTPDPAAIGVDEPTPEGIARAIGRRIASGELPAGTRLPTVRAMAAHLGISPATVSHGWQSLARSGLVVTRGRSGTFVMSAATSVVSGRTLGLAGRDSDVRLDLSRGSPDPNLLPEIAGPLATVARRAETTNYHEHPVVPELGALLNDSWPTRSDALTIVNGALDAVSRALAAVTRFGDRVIVENPTFPQFLDLLEVLGLTPLPVELDDEGPDPTRFAAALSESPAAAIIQPRAHNPTGRSISARRARKLAQLLRNNGRCIVIEDDHTGSAATAADVSLGHWIPDQVLHVRSFSKSHGPDLRIAAMSGPAAVIDSIVARRMLGPGWTPRIIQRLLYELLSDAEVERTIARSAIEYRRRHTALTNALTARGVIVTPGEGLNAWVAVADERRALVDLAATGIRVAPGTPFQATPAVGEHLRVTVAPLDATVDIDAVADALAVAARPSRGEFFSLTRR
jgi:DNA-binding transcriptional MocR family regulator